MGPEGVRARRKRQGHFLREPLDLEDEPEDLEDEELERPEELDRPDEEDLAEPEERPEEDPLDRGAL